MRVEVDKRIMGCAANSCRHSLSYSSIPRGHLAESGSFVCCCFVFLSLCFSLSLVESPIRLHYLLRPVMIQRCCIQFTCCSFCSCEHRARNPLCAHFSVGRFNRAFGKAYILTENDAETLLFEGEEYSLSHFGLSCVTNDQRLYRVVETQALFRERLVSLSSEWEQWIKTLPSRSV